MGNLKLINEDAINKIADNFKNIIDGGSKELKNAIEAYDIVSN